MVRFRSLGAIRSRRLSEYGDDARDVIDRCLPRAHLAFRALDRHDERFHGEEEARGYFDGPALTVSVSWEVRKPAPRICCTF